MHVNTLCINFSAESSAEPRFGDPFCSLRSITDSCWLKILQFAKSPLSMGKVGRIKMCSGGEIKEVKVTGDGD